MREEVQGRTGKAAGRSRLWRHAACEAQQIETLERQREQHLAELKGLEQQQQAAEVLRAIGEKDVRALLASLAANLEEVDREALKELTASLLERVELCPTALQCRLHYRFAAGDLLASPRQTQEFPALRVVRLLKLAA